jgi:hypothetical protein
MSHAAMPINTYRAIHTGPNQLFGGVHPGFANAAYQSRAADDAAGENAAPIAPAANAAPTKAARASQFGREFRPR